MARKKKNTDEGSGADVGIVMTCSLFLIILTFFILLNSIAVIDDRKQRLAIGSLVGSFGSLSGGLSPLKTGSSIMPSSAPIAEQVLDFDKFLSALDINILSKAKIVTTQGQGTISINEKVLFDKGTHLIKASQIPLLDKLSGFINKGNYPIEITGHTDNRPAQQKGYTSNWEITSLMAIQVLQYLVEKGNVSPKRITAYGRGNQDPVTSNDTRESRSLNRRVELILKYDTPEHEKRIFRERPAGNFTYKRFNFKVF
jgi:chemotaxis protein MotB